MMSLEWTASPISMLTPKAVKDKIKCVAVPQAESWRIVILKELLDVRSHNLTSQTSAGTKYEP